MIVSMYNWLRLAAMVVSYIAVITQSLTKGMASMSIIYQNRTERFQFFTSTNNSFGAHLHRQIELIVVLEGTMTVSVDHTQYVLSINDGIIIFPNQLHSLYTENHSQILLCIFEKEFCPSYKNIFQIGHPTIPTFTLNQHSPHSNVAVNGLLSLTPECSLLLSEGYLTLLLASILEHIKLSTEPTYADFELEQNLLLYIDAHYTEDLSLEILSKEFGVSRFRLSRLFADTLHTSFPSYVNSKRLEYGKSRLESTTLSVTQLALDAGFGSSRTFFREFKHTYGISPGEYRKNYLFTNP